MMQERSDAQKHSNETLAGGFCLGFVAGCLFTLLLWAIPAHGQQQPPDPAKLVPILKQQREMAFDGVASCAATVVDQNARIADLEKQLADAKAAPK
jgi:hypothetical protein